MSITDGMGIYRTEDSLLRKPDEQRPPPSGMVIGGPLDGRLVAHHGLTISIVNSSKASAVLSLFTYKAVKVAVTAATTRSADAMVTFWVPEDKDIEWALEQLSVEYAKSRQKVATAA